MAAHTPNNSKKRTHPTREQHLSNQISSFKRLLFHAEMTLEDDKEALGEAEQRAAQALRTELLQVEVQANEVLAEIYQTQHQHLMQYQRSTAMYRKWWWPILLVLASMFGSLLPGMAMADLRDEQRRRDMLDQHERELHHTHQRLLSRLNYLRSQQQDPVTSEIRQAREKVSSSRRQADTLRWQIQRLEVELDSLRSSSHP